MADGLADAGSQQVRETAGLEDSENAERAVEPKPTRQQIIDRGKWKQKAGRFYYLDGRGKRVSGLVTIKGRRYYFDAKGVQRTGWQKVSGGYRFFRIANKAPGSLVTGRVVNGIRLDSEGAAVYGSQGKAELKLMVTANRIYQKVTRPAWKQSKRLRACFDWMRYKCHETYSRKFHNVPGWHRAYARDTLVRRHGSCFSHAAGFAYLANACGMKQVAVVSSGGHGWTEVNHKVTDVSWTRVVHYLIYNTPYGTPGRGMPDFKHNRSYVVTLTRTKPRDAKVTRKASAKTTVAKKGGLVSRVRGVQADRGALLLQEAPL